MSEADIRSERERKLRLLEEAGMPAYPIQCDRTHTIQQALEHFEQLSEGTQTLTIAGRILSRRGQGGILFADLFDGSARMQIVLKKDEMPELLFNLFADTVDTGDFVEASGALFVTKRGEQSLRVESWRMLSKSLRTIPTEWFGIQDEELKLRERYLTMLVDPEVRAIVSDGRDSGTWFAGSISRMDSWKSNARAGDVARRRGRATVSDASQRT